MTQPHHSAHTADTIQIKRADRGLFDLGSFFESGLNLVKDRPVETIGLGFAFFCAQVAIQLTITAIQMGGQFVTMQMLRAVKLNSMELVQFIVAISKFGTSIVGNAMMTTVNVLITGMLYIMWLRLVRQQDFEFSDLLEVRRFFVPLIVSGLIVGIATSIGTMACIIPGVIIGLGLMFTSLVVLDTGLGPVEAVKASWKLTDGHKLDMFLFVIVSFFVNIAGMLACGLGIFITIPITLGASVYFYNSLAHPHNAYLKPNENPDPSVYTDHSVNHHNNMPGGGAGW